MKSIRLSIEYIRVLPFIGTAFSILHMAILLLAGDNGYEANHDFMDVGIYVVSFIVEKVWSLFLLAGFLTVSKSFGFCKLHRLAIIHLFLTYACYDYQRLIGFGDKIVIVRTAILMIGIIILAVFFMTKDCHNKEKDEA